MRTTLDLFAGCGGAALGLQRAGWRHLACVERDPAAAATLAAAGLPALCADVREVDWAPFAGRVDLLWASPPCQPGSTAGHRLGARDPRDGWPWTWAVLDAVRPTWFLAENVLGWTYHARGCRLDGEHEGCTGCAWQRRVLPALGARFAFSGAWRLDAADFGVPQHRRRVLLWGGPLPLRPPAPTHGDPDDEDTAHRGIAPWRTVRDAVGGTLLAADACEHRACYPCDGSHGRACQEPWRADAPAPTVTASEAKGTRAHAPDWSFHGGPDRASDAAFLVAGVRRIEVAEGLRLQGLPDDWPLQGTREEQYRQVGNAVPPALAEAAGRVVAVAHHALAALRARGIDLHELAGVLRRREAA
jgi:DNA (cytosine-5)-methyltransferase 1